jgi:ferritin-like protein
MNKKVYLSISLLNYAELDTKTDKNLLSVHESVQREDKRMPSEIFDAEKFVAMSAHAEYCHVKRFKDAVKLKLRTPSKLYTLKVEPLKADELIKKLKCKIEEL